MEKDGIELITAAATGIVEMAEACLKQGASIHANNDMALRTAALMGNADMVRFLVGKGANVQAAGNEALLYAVKRGDEPVVEFLLANGADIADMLRQHKKSIDQDCLDLLDKYQSQKLREAFEKNFRKLKKPSGKLKPKNPRP